jgi:hypothetical protein
VTAEPSGFMPAFRITKGMKLYRGGGHCELVLENVPEHNSLFPTNRIDTMDIDTCEIKRFLYPADKILMLGSEAA